MPSLSIEEIIIDTCHITQATFDTRVKPFLSLHMTELEVVARASGILIPDKLMSHQQAEVLVEVALNRIDW